jgi:hypothetical protein
MTPKVSQLFLITATLGLLILVTFSTILTSNFIKKNADVDQWILSKNNIPSYDIVYTNDEFYDFTVNNPKFNESLNELIQNWPYNKPYDNAIVVYGITEVDGAYIVNLLTRTDPKQNEENEINVEITTEILIDKTNLEYDYGEANIANVYLNDDTIKELNNPTLADSIRNFVTPKVNADTTTYPSFTLPFYKESKAWRVFTIAWHPDTPGLKYNPLGGSPQNLHSYNAIDIAPELSTRRSYYVMKDGVWVIDTSGVEEYLATDYKILAPDDITITSICASGAATNPYNQSWISFKDNQNRAYGIAHIDKRTLKVVAGQSVKKGTVLGSLLKGDVQNQNAGTWSDTACGTAYAAYWPHIHYKVPTISGYNSSGVPNASVPAYFDGVFVCKDFLDPSCYRTYACGTNNAETCYMHNVWDNKVDFNGSISQNTPVSTQSILTSPAALTTINLNQAISITLGNNLFKTNVKLYDSSTTFLTADYQNENGALKTFTTSGWVEDGRILTLEINSYTDSSTTTSSKYNFYAKKPTTILITGKSKSNLNIRSCNSTTCSSIGTLYTSVTSNIVCRLYNSSNKINWVRIDTNPLSSVTNNKWVAGDAAYMNIYKNGAIISVTDPSIPTCPTSTPSTSTTTTSSSTTTSTVNNFTYKVPPSTLNVRKCASTTKIGSTTCSIISTLSSTSTGKIVCKYYNTSSASYWVRIDTNLVNSSSNNKWISAGSSYITIYLNGTTTTISNTLIPNCTSGI